MRVRRRCSRPCIRRTVLSGSGWASSDVVVAPKRAEHVPPFERQLIAPGVEITVPLPVDADRQPVQIERSGDVGRAEGLLRLRATSSSWRSISAFLRLPVALLRGLVRLGDLELVDLRDDPVAAVEVAVRLDDPLAGVVGGRRNRSARRCCSTRTLRPSTHAPFADWTRPLSTPFLSTVRTSTRVLYSPFLRRFFFASASPTGASTRPASRTRMRRTFGRITRVSIVIALTPRSRRPAEDGPERLGHGVGIAHAGAAPPPLKVAPTVRSTSIVDVARLRRAAAGAAPAGEGRVRVRGRRQAHGAAVRESRWHVPDRLAAVDPGGFEVTVPGPVTLTTSVSVPRWPPLLPPLLPAVAVPLPTTKRSESDPQVIFFFLLLTVTFSISARMTSPLPMVPPVVDEPLTLGVGVRRRHGARRCG